MTTPAWYAYHIQNFSSVQLSSYIAVLPLLCVVQFTAAQGAGVWIDPLCFEELKNALEKALQVAQFA